MSSLSRKSDILFDHILQFFLFFKGVQGCSYDIRWENFLKKGFVHIFNLESFTQIPLNGQVQGIIYIYIPERFHSNGYQKWDIRNYKEMSSFMHLHQHNT